MLIKTLFLACEPMDAQDTYSLIGKFDVYAYLTGNHIYEFETLPECTNCLWALYPETFKKYYSWTLPPQLQNRSMNRSRPELSTYFKHLGLLLGDHQIKELSITHGYRMTDPFFVFPKIEPDSSGDFKEEFLLKGLEFSEESLELVESLNCNTKLRLSQESTYCTKILTEDNIIVGELPPFFSFELKQAGNQVTNLNIEILQQNSKAAPFGSKVLLKLSGNFGSYIPMNSNRFNRN